MKLEIQKADPQTIGFVNQLDNSFFVDSRLELSLRTGKLTYEIVPVPGFQKTYPTLPADYTSFLDQPDKAVYFAYADGQLAGQIILTESWNRYGYIQDLVVQTAWRKQGIGSALIRQAIAWAKGRELPGLMLETQDINVNACRLYERMGFQLSGFDRALYNPILPTATEIALYWYLFF